MEDDLSPSRGTPAYTTDRFDGRELHSEYSRLEPSAAVKHVRGWHGINPELPEGVFGIGLNTDSADPFRRPRVKELTESAESARVSHAVRMGA